MNESSGFGRWLKKRRQAEGLTQKDLAAEIGCSAVTIEKLEAGTRRPSRQIAELLAEWLGVPPAERPTFARFARGEAHPATDAASTLWHRSEYQVGALPAPTTGFVGRGALIERVTALLRRPAIRLVTLTGPPGIGKTRLSLQVAQAVRADFAAGVGFIPLGSVPDPTAVVTAIGTALHLTEQGDQPLLAQIQARLQDHHLLLVLDNFEHVLASATLVTTLLEAAPGLKILVTSRAILHVYGEHEVSVPPLTLPDPSHLPPLDQVRTYEAIQLFTERAQAAQPDFTLTPANVAGVATICARLDGLPLALELAAARLRRLPMEAILQGLENRLALLAAGPHDRPARQQSWQAALAWSEALLTPSEQTLFRRLAVFTGGGSDDAVRWIASPDAEPRANVQTLVDQSLLWRTQGAGDAPRTGMLETIRDYAWERLATSGEAGAVEDRHTAYYLEMAEQAAQQLTGARQGEALDRLEQEHGNLRAAIQRTIRRGQAELALRLAGALWLFWYTRGYLSEGRHWLAAALALPDAPTSPARARALTVLGVLAQRQGDHAAAADALEAGVALWRRLDDPAGLARALHNRAGLALVQGAHAQARAGYTESLALSRRLADPRGEAVALNNLAILAYSAGEPEQALALGTASLERFAELGDQASVARVRVTLGEAARLLGDATGAADHFARALASFRALGDRRSTGLALANLGQVEHRSGAVESAESHLRESLVIAQEVDDPVGVAVGLGALAGVAATRGAATTAARLLGTAAALLERLGLTLEATDQADFDQNAEAVRSALGASEFAAQYAAGCRMSLDAALALAARPVENGAAPLLPPAPEPG